MESTEFEKDMDKLLLNQRPGPQLKTVEAAVICLARAAYEIAWELRKIAVELKLLKMR